jgi:translocation and assembly module TamB
MQANYSIADLPLSLANAVMPASVPLVFEGTIGGQGDIAASADGTLRGRAEIRSDKGRITRQLEATADAPEVLLTYDDLNLTADLAGPDANARLSARLDEGGTLQGRLAARGLAQASTSLDGAVDAMLPNLRVVELFAPQLANVQGRAELHAAVRGTLDDPELSGEFRATNLATDIPQVGLKLKDGTLSVAPTSKDSFRIAGNITSGQGRLDISGDATTAGVVRMKLSGKRFQAADIPAVNVIIDPQLEFERVPERMSLTGSVHVPSAHIDLQKLPKKERTQGVSSDVVVIDAKTQEEAKAEGLPLFANVKVTLSDQVVLVGYGLDAKVTGELDVKEQPGAATSGSGVVRVAGTYKAYGQDLEIRQGQLMFAGTPLDNPRLNFVAVRVIDDADVIAGLKVAGSAQSPELTVFSEPAMSQSDALAYVVTGKPLSEVGEGEGDGDMLQAAARSLGTAGGGVLAKSIGKRLGVDEFGIEDSEALGGAALTIGQYLSPRLFVSYGVGVFEPGNVLTVRYKLSKELAFEALNSTNDSQAAIEYRMER